MTPRFELYRQFLNRQGEAKTQVAADRMTQAYVKKIGEDEFVLQSQAFGDAFLQLSNPDDDFQPLWRTIHNLFEGTAFSKNETARYACDMAILSWITPMTEEPVEQIHPHNGAEDFYHMEWKLGQIEKYRQIENAAYVIRMRGDGKNPFAKKAEAIWSSVIEQLYGISNEATKEILRHRTTPQGRTFKEVPSFVAGKFLKIETLEEALLADAASEVRGASIYLKQASQLVH